jgi:hypothetical protein
VFLEGGCKLHAHSALKSLSCVITNCIAIGLRLTAWCLLYPPVLALSKRNTNAAEVILFLHRFVQVLVEYFKELEEESIRDNFVIIYELMDEMMDFGFPQTTESKILQESVAFSTISSGKKTRLTGVQIHHAGVVQTRGASTTANRGH